MSEKQYRVARKGIVEQIKLAQKLHCTNLAQKHSAALKKLELRFLQPDATGCFDWGARVSSSPLSSINYRDYMEAKINIAEILADKPIGTKLYTDAFGELSIEDICTEDEQGITLLDEDRVGLFFYNDGRYSIFGEPILVPSKLMHDWSKFSWKKGDVLVNKDNVHIIFEKFEDDAYTRFKGKHYLWKECDEEDYSKEETKMLTSVFEKANDYEAQTYINTIEERLGGKLNLETLEIEKQSEFKDGDVVFVRCKRYCFIEIFNHFKNNNLNDYASLNTTIRMIDIGGEYPIFKDEIVEIRLATDSEKKQLFEALAKKGKAWDAEKKQIVDLKPKCEFKPFDRCIWKIRNCEGSIWQASFVSYVDEYGATPMGMSIDEDLVNLIILPYNDQTKLLVGTTDEWEGGEQ